MPAACNIMHMQLPFVHDSRSSADGYRKGYRPIDIVQWICNLIWTTFYVLDNIKLILCLAICKASLSSCLLYRKFKTPSSSQHQSSQHRSTPQSKVTKVVDYLQVARLFPFSLAISRRSVLTLN